MIDSCRWTRIDDLKRTVVFSPGDSIVLNRVVTSWGLKDQILMDSLEQQLHLSVQERVIFVEVTFNVFPHLVAGLLESFCSADIQCFMSIPRCDYFHHELHFFMIWTLSVCHLRSRIHMMSSKLFEWLCSTFLITWLTIHQIRSEVGRRISSRFEHFTFLV